MKYLGLAAAAAMLLAIGLWAVGLFGSKPSNPEPVQQAKAESKKNNPGNSQKDEPSKKGGLSTDLDIPKPGAEKVELTAPAQDKSAVAKIGKGSPDQQKPAPPKQVRAERLARVRENNKRKIHTISTEIPGLGGDLARLTKLLAANSPEDLPPNERTILRHELEKRQALAKKRESPGQLPTLIVEENVLAEKRHAWNKERADALRLLKIAEKRLVEAHQEERRIMALSPEGGDPSFVEHDGLLYTNNELFHNLFAVPFRYGTLGQVTGFVTEADAKNLDIRYTLLIPERPGFNPPPAKVRFFTRKLVLSNATDVRIWSKRKALEQKDKPPTKKEIPPPGDKSVGFPSPAEIMAKQKQGKPIQPKEIFPGGDNPGGFPATQLERGKPTVDNHGNPVFTEDMIKGYRQETMKSLKRGQEVSVFFSNDDHAVVIVIMQSN